MKGLAIAKPLLTKTAANWTEDNVPRLAAAFSFYAILSIAPVLILAVTVASAFLSKGEAERHLLGQVREFTGGGKAVESFVEGIIQGAKKPGSGTLATAFSLIVTFFSASNLFLQLEDTVNVIWGIQQKGSAIRNLITTRLLAFAAVAVFGGLILSWLALDSWLNYIAKITPGPQLYPLLSTLGGIGFFTLAFAVAFRGMPKGRTKWRDVWPGAFVSSIGFALSKQVFAFYFAYAGVSTAYGAAGALVVLLLWIYYSSQIFFFGLEVTYTYAKEYGSLKGQNPGDLKYS